MSENMINSFSIYGLWETKNVDLKFHDNNLILVGENGSGKTTILRIIYETLSCNWAMLSIENFISIEINFSSGKNIKILKEKLKQAKKLVIRPYSDIILDSLPVEVRSLLINQSRLSGKNITYEQVLDTLRECDYHDQTIITHIQKKIESINMNYSLNYTKEIQSAFNYNIIYLPTYRRVEKNFSTIDDTQARRGFAFDRINRKNSNDKTSIEIARWGMDDVEASIQQALWDIHRQADTSASRLIYKCFKDILNKNIDKVRYEKEKLSEVEIEKIFGSINEDIISLKESEQIQQLLKEMKSSEAPKKQSYEQIVYFFYYKLYERYIQISNEEKKILTFFNACNAYLRNKKFIYNKKNYTYSICVEEGTRKQNIQLEHLSSGEKQVVAIFSYLYLSSFTKSLILIDEPELSLSVPWQKTFLDDISKGEKCGGIIAVTHSPFIFDNTLKKYTHSLEEFINMKD